MAAGRALRGMPRRARLHRFAGRQGRSAVDGLSDRFAENRPDIWPQRQASVPRHRHAMEARPSGKWDCRQDHLVLSGPRRHHLDGQQRLRALQTRGERRRQGVVCVLFDGERSSQQCRERRGGRLQRSSMGSHDQRRLRLRPADRYVHQLYRARRLCVVAVLLERAAFRRQGTYLPGRRQRTHRADRPGPAAALCRTPAVH